MANVVISENPGDVILVDGNCYEFLAKTSKDITNPMEDVDAIFDDCRDCEGDNFIIVAAVDCGCYLSPDRLSLGNLGAGTYRITYISGATRTNQTGWYNVYLHQHGSSVPQLCGGPCGPGEPTCYTSNWSDGELPGYTWWKGFATIAEVEAYYAGAYTDFVWGGGVAYAWYQDNGCGDNDGSITYNIKKIA